jgi:hypothetical protein
MLKDPGHIENGEPLTEAKKARFGSKQEEENYLRERNAMQIA